MGLRLAQEKALKRQLEEEQKLKPGGVGAPSSSSARPGPPQPDEAVDFREEGPEGETPAIFISVDEDPGLPEAALLDSSLEGPLPKVGLAPRSGEEGAPGAGSVSAGPEAAGRAQPSSCPDRPSRPQEAAAGAAPKEERSPQPRTPAGEDHVKTPSPPATAAEEAGDPEAKGNS